MSTTTADQSSTPRPNTADPALPDALYYDEGKDVVDIRASVADVAASA